jgi:hypothetical protein
MRKIKRLSFLLAFVAAVVMFTSCGQKHKGYIPADSKVVGKIDIKAFFDQTGADRNKLMEDMEEYLGKDVEKIKEMGLDVKDPIYIFGRGKGTNYTFGAVAKVDDKNKVKDWFADNIEIEIDKEGDGFEYFAEGNTGIGLNGDALVMIVCSSGDAKKDIKKIMGKEYDGDLGDNKLFDKVQDANSFACLYADLSIISEDIVKMLERQAPQMKESLDDMRKMIVGLDGNCSDGVCDFSYWAESEDEKVQKKIDESLATLNEIDEKAIETVPDDAIGGLVANVDGPKLSKNIDKSLKEAKLLDELPAEFKDLYNKFLALIGDVNGNFAGYFVAPMDLMIAVESKNNTADKIAELINTLQEEFSSPSFAGAPDFAEDEESLSYEPTQFDEEEVDDAAVDDYENYNFDSEFDTSSTFTIEKTADGYCGVDENGTKFWFGNKNGALYFTSNESLIPSVFKKADKPVPSELVSFATSRKFMYFFSLGKIKDYTAPMDKEVQKVFNAFDEIISKINYITFSMK